MEIRSSMFYTNWLLHRYIQNGTTMASLVAWNIPFSKNQWSNDERKFYDAPHQYEAVHLPLGNDTYICVTDLYDIPVLLLTQKSINLSSFSYHYILLLVKRGEFIFCKNGTSTFWKEDEVIWS